MNSSVTRYALVPTALHLPLLLCPFAPLYSYIPLSFSSSSHFVALSLVIQGWRRRCHGRLAPSQLIR